MLSDSTVDYTKIIISLFHFKLRSLAALPSPACLMAFFRAPKVAKSLLPRPSPEAHWYHSDSISLRWLEGACISSVGLLWMLSSSPWRNPREVPISLHLAACSFSWSSSFLWWSLSLRRVESPDKELAAVFTASEIHEESNNQSQSPKCTYVLNKLNIIMNANLMTCNSLGQNHSSHIHTQSLIRLAW